MKENFNTLVKEYKGWIEKDSLSTLGWVRPSLMKNIQGLKLQHFGNNPITIFENDNEYQTPNFKFLDEVRRVKFDPTNEDYFTVMRMDTLEPWKNTKVSWPLYDNYAAQYWRNDETYTELGMNSIDQLTLALLEMGLHEALEWISVTECGVPEKSNNLPTKLIEFPTWPHDRPTKNDDFCGYGKLNNNWYKLTVSF